MICGLLTNCTSDLRSGGSSISQKGVPISRAQTYYLALFLQKTAEKLDWGSTLVPLDSPMVSAQCDHDITHSFHDDSWISKNGQLVSKQ